MEISKAEREKIFWEEIQTLFNQGLINDIDFKRISNAYQKNKFNQMKKSASIQHAPEKRESQKTELTQHVVPKQPTQQTVPKYQKQQVTITKQPKAPAKTIEQTRERNIKWSLILGVIFLLISGLVIATTTWEQMGPLLKVVSLLGVSFFFLALSAVIARFLKLDKTAFAFLTLGSLLIPIAIIAIGYFNLFGEYLSLTGEGKFLLGIIGSLVSLPLYMRNAWKHQSKLFVWISYLFMTILAGFTIAATKVSVDVFYLLIMIYNAALLMAFHKLRNNKTILLFTKELPIYAQLNLVVSTLLMLAIFDQQLFNSFTILLTAALYFATIFVTNKKEYQFVFSALFAYGAFQLTEHSWLGSIDLIVFGMIGASYLIFAFLVKSDAFMSRIFYWTSGLISIFAFIYISFQGIIIRSGENPWILLMAYIIVTGTYTYLAQITKKPIFSWLAGIFLYTVGLQLCSVGLDYSPNMSVQLFIFGYASALFLLLGLFNKNKYLSSIKQSVYYLSIGALLASIMLGILVAEFLQVSFMFVTFGVLALLVSKQKNNVEHKIANWTNAVSWLLALFFLYPKLTDVITGYSTQLSIPFHFSISALLLLAISVVWQKYNKKGLAHSAFYSAQASYLFGLFQLMYGFPINETFVRPILLLIGIAVFVWLVYRSRVNMLWSLVSITSLAFYTSLLSTFSIDGSESITVFMLGSPLLLLAVDHFAGKSIPALKPHFFWLAHGIQPLIILVILINQAFYQTIRPIFLFVPLIVYLYSSIIKTKEWQIKLFLYSAMTMTAFVVLTHVAYYDLFENIPLIYCWFGSSIIFALSWLFVNTVWRKRIDWYLIPFANYGLFTLITIHHGSTLLETLSALAFVGMNLFFLHKRNWVFYTAIPLILTLFLWENQRYVLTDVSLLVISLVSFIVLFLAGRLLFKRLWDLKERYIDWYSIVALFYLGYSLTFIQSDTSVWVRIIPYLLLTVWLFAHTKRFTLPIMEKVMVTIGAISLLPSYYIILGEYIDDVAEIFHAELIALPILVLCFMLSIKTWKSHPNIMKYVQLGSLVLITIYLISDTLQSNTVWDGFIIIAINLIFLHKRKWLFYTAIPLALTLLLWENQRYLLTDMYLLVISLVSAIILFVAGRLLFKRIWDLKERYIDWYAIVALFYLGYALTFIQSDTSVWVHIMPYLLLTIWLFAHTKRFTLPIMEKVMVTIGAISLLPSYYIVLGDYIDHIANLFHAELIALPILLLSIILSIKTWKNYQHIMTHIQLATLVLIAIYLVSDAIQSNTVWDALIIGTLSLLSLLVGMQLQIKSYFFVGLVTLLFNIFYQTRSYWGNMPWWGYLLIAGLTLIGSASYNEWKKQNSGKGKLELKARELLSALKKWK